MIRTTAIVVTVGLTLAVTSLSGYGVRGPLYMPKVPPAPVAPQTTGPGIADPDVMPQSSAPDAKPIAADAANVVFTNH